MKVLLTGARGFTGKYMLQELRLAGHEVSSLNANLLDVKALNAELSGQNYAAVIHLAAISTVENKPGENHYEVNLIGTRNLLDALERTHNKLSAVLLASSGQVYGNSGSTVTNSTAFEGFNEGALLQPSNEYAVSKCAMEQMARLWANDFPIIIARPFNYTGCSQNDKFLVPKIVSHFRNKLSVMEIGDVSLLREFGDVRDVVLAYRLLIENIGSLPQNEINIFNICTGNPLKISDLIENCSQISGHKINLKLNPAFLRPGEPKILIGNTKKFDKYFPKFRRRSISETLSWMLGDMYESIN